MKLDFEKTYRERIEEIDNQIKKLIRLKHWGKKKLLENEKEKLEKLLKEIEVHNKWTV